MNLHLIQDTVFLNDFAELLSDKGVISKHHFFVYYTESKTKGEYKYLQASKFNETQLISNNLDELPAIAGGYKNIFIHLLSDSLIELLPKISAKSQIFWCTWGADFYCPDEIFKNIVFDAKSEKVFSGWKTEKDISEIRNYPKSKKRKLLEKVNSMVDQSYYKKLAEKESSWKMKTYMDWKQNALKSVKYLLNYGVEDYEFIKQQYKISPKYLPFFYTTFDERDNTIQPSSYLENKFSLTGANKKVFIGNCGTFHNNHLELLPLLETIKNQYSHTKFIVPLSYGDKRYIEFISGEYKSVLGEDFCPIYDFINKQEYYNMLGTIDVMIMNHNINQGGTNLFKTIYYGKKILLKKRNPLGIHLRKNGVKLTYIEDIDQSVIDTLFTPLSEETISNNRRAINSVFSKQIALDNLDTILSYC